MWSNSQPTRIFGWSTILSNWDGTKPEEVSTVLYNLANNDCPTNYFITYMNEEHDALKWFIYECVASSWMWNGAPHLGYIQDILPLINVDSRFPVFPGSPTCTVREFLTGSLNENQLEYIQMLPMLVPEERATQPCICRALPGMVKFHIVRNLNNQNDDDTLIIRKTGDDQYTYTYTDPQNVTGKTYTQTLDGEGVMLMLRNMFNLLVLDSEPFNCIQVMMPTLPIISINIEDLGSSTRDILYDSMELLMQSWPVPA